MSLTAKPDERGREAPPLRRTTFQTRNNQTVEIFLGRRRGGFELWVVGMQDLQRVILNHYLTHDDIEARLRYSKSVLLTWGTAKTSDLPYLKSAASLEEEETIKRGFFWDSDELCEHLGGVEALDCERATLATARTNLVGAWTDGAALLTFAADGSFGCSIPSQGSLNFLSQAAATIEPDAWHFSDNWQLRLTNRKTARSERRLLHHVSQAQLHLAGEGNCIAHVLRRITKA